MLRRLCLALAILLPACASAPAIIGRMAPDFSLTDQKGLSWATHDFKNGTVLLDFWATWCQPCLEAIPDLNAFNAKHSGKIKLLGVALESKGWDGVKPVITKQEISYPTALGTSDLASAYGIDSLPTLILIRDGKVVKELIGRHSLAELEEELSEYL
jgi:thiol-disulfide isomerase/thioredoxin